MRPARRRGLESTQVVIYGQSALGHSRGGRAGSPLLAYNTQEAEEEAIYRPGNFVSDTSHSPDSADSELSEIEHTVPLLERIVRWRLGGRATAQDHEDVVSETVLHLLTRMDSVRRGEAEAITDLAAYAATAAQHGCDRYLRARFPQRHRLGNRLRYFLERSRTFAVWRQNDISVCGFARQKGQPAKTNLAPDWVKEVATPRSPTEATSVEAVFTYVQEPLRLADLIDAVAFLLNINDRISSIPDLDIAATEPTLAPGQLDEKALAALWEEIKQLPEAQRSALLLHVRHEDGSTALTSFIAAGIASMRDIADALGMAALELASLWKKLPLDDLTLSGMLNLTRQQVINLRMAARKRLSRRWLRNEGNITPKSTSKQAKVNRD